MLAILDAEMIAAHLYCESDFEIEIFASRPEGSASIINNDMQPVLSINAEENDFTQSLMFT